MQKCLNIQQLQGIQNLDRLSQLKLNNDPKIVFIGRVSSKSKVFFLARMINAILFDLFFHYAKYSFNVHQTYKCLIFHLFEGKHSLSD